MMNKNKIKNKKMKRKGGISVIVATIIVLLIVLSCIPSLKSIANANSTASNNIRTDIVNVTK